MKLPFLVTERTPAGRMTSTVRAANYDARYYANDKDYILGLITEEAYGPNGNYTPDTGNEFPQEAVPTYNMVAQTINGVIDVGFDRLQGEYGTLDETFLENFQPPVGTYTCVRLLSNVVEGHVFIDFHVQGDVSSGAPVIGMFETLRIVGPFVDLTLSRWDASSTTFSRRRRWLWDMGAGTVSLFADTESYNVELFTA